MSTAWAAMLKYCNFGKFRVVRLLHHDNQATPQPKYLPVNSDISTQTGFSSVKKLLCYNKHQFLHATHAFWGSRCSEALLQHVCFLSLYLASASRSSQHRIQDFSAQDSNIHLAILHTSTDIGEAEGPHAATAISWCGLRNPLWLMFQSVHQAKWAGLSSTA